MGRPIGFEDPPRPGDYSPVDDRTWRQRRDDFVNYDKHLERRKQLEKQLMKGYYKDWAMLRFERGKTFLSNPKIFKADLALYFPNIVGRTLVSSAYNDTTPLLYGKVSIVSIFTTKWADDQVKTFISPTDNPEVKELIEGSEGKAQHIYVNVEDNKMKWWVLWASQWNIRKVLPKREWPNYFMVNYELPEVIRETLGLINKNVGYLFLVDENCRIRWAGSGDARPEEKDSLIRGLRRLIDQSLQRGEKQDTQQEVEKQLEAQAVSAGAS